MYRQDTGRPYIIDCDSPGSGSNWFLIKRSGDVTLAEGLYEDVREAAKELGIADDDIDEY